MMNGASVLALLGIMLLPMAGCASAQAKGRGDEVPALNVPPPPPRVIEAVPEPLPEVIVEPIVPPTTTTPNRPSRPPVKEPKAQPSEAKPAEQKPPETPPTEPAAVVLPPPAPSAQLRTPQTAATSEANVRATVERARTILNGVNFGALSTERKKAYNDAKLFIQQAEDALKQGNVVFAQGVAAKAETLARELAGR
jgi:outer membrane biosynthesis protein TonB